MSGAASKLLTRDEAATRLTVSKTTLDRLIARGELRAVKLSRRAVRIAEADLEVFIHGRQTALPNQTPLKTRLATKRRDDFFR